MYCENCGKNYANVKYTQIINGKKKEIFLCEECSKMLGIESFNIPMDFSTFLEDFFSSFEKENIFPELLNMKELRCKRCNSSFEDFINTGMFGCPECYETFEEKIDPLLRNIQGANRHVGRLGNVNEEIEAEAQNGKRKDETEDGKEKNETKSEKSSKEIDKAKNINSPAMENFSEIEELKKKLKIAIKEEKYEEAAILRDRIKELE